MRLHSGEDQSFELHIARKTEVNKTANSENIFKTGHLSYLLTFDVIENQHPAALNLTFIRRNRRSFCFVWFAINIS